LRVCLRIIVGLSTSLHFNTVITKLDKENFATCPRLSCLIAVSIGDIVSDSSLFMLDLSGLIPARGFKMYLQYYINEKGDKVYTTKVV
jgi:hypothetical protein